MIFLGPWCPMNQLDSIQPLPDRSPTDSLGQAFCQHGAHLRQVANRGLAADLAAKVGASDVVQDTFWAASRDRHQYRGNSPQELRGWLEQILRNRLHYLRRYFRTSARRQVSREVPAGLGGEGFTGQVAAPPSPSPLSRVVRDERATALRIALGQLSAADTQLIRWHEQDGLTFAVIGDLLGISEEAARKRWARALKRLRDLLGPAHDSR